jgi:hypothetical protein
LKVFGFQKEGFKRGEEFERKNVFSGDFDVFASCPSCNPHINSLVAVKKQPKEETPTAQHILFQVPPK